MSRQAVARLLDERKLADVDVVVNLSGETIGKRWSGGRRRAIRESRVRGTETIAGAIERMYRSLMRRASEAPTVLVSGGAADKILPIIELPHQLVPSVIFDGLLCMADERQPTQPTLLPDSGVRG